jgi:hypothetical protein
MLFVERIFAAGDIVGPITNPITRYGNATDPNAGIIAFLGNILRLVFVVAGIYAFINLIIAGFTYMTAGGDAKQMNAAWSRIWQSLLGLVIIVGSFALASLIGAVVFGDPTFILNPKIYGPR